ncbi:MAG: MFS transporter [Chloroflexi bacterium]|nr:MFS transporter [Chloroflexota bacterium]
MNKKAFAALCLVMFVAQIGLGIVAPFLPLYAKSMNASGTWIGIMFAAYGLSRLFLMPLAGRLSDFGNRKMFILGGLALFSVISLVYILATDIYQLTLIRLVHGAATSMIVPIAEAYIADLIPKGKDATYINFFSMWRFLGAGAGPVLGGVVAEVFGVNAAFYTMSGIGVLALALCALYVPRTAPSARRGHGGGASYGKLFKDNRVKGICVYQVSRSFWRHGSSTFLPILAASSLMMGEARIGLLLAVYQMADGVVQGVMGPIGDRYSKVALLVIFSFAGAAAMFLIPNVTSVALMFLVIALIAVFDGMARGSAMAMNVEIGRQHQGMGTMIGISHSATDFGTVLGPAAFGYFSDLYGLTAAFYIGAGFGIGTTLISGYLFSRVPREVARPAPEMVK